MHRIPTITRSTARLALALLACAVGAAADEPALKVTVNRTQVYLGESFIVETTVSGSSQAAEPDLSRIRNCRIKPLGSRNISNYSITIVNGRLVKEGFTGRMASFEVTPTAAGALRVGPVSVTLEGRTLTEPGPVVTVTDIEKQDLVLISVDSSRETVLVDEPFEVTLRVLIRRLPGRFENTEPLFTDNPPDLSAPYLSGEGLDGLVPPDLQRILQDRLVTERDQPGLAVNNLTYTASPFDFDSLFQGLSGRSRKARFGFPRRLVIQNGVAYVEYSLALAFTPKDEGNYVFGPVVFKGSVPVEVNNEGQARGCPVFAVGPARTVRVVPPPEEGRPASFSGAIGTNLAAAAALDACVGNVGDPLQLTLSLSGDVLFDRMLPPKLSLQTNILQGFSVYDNTVQTVKGTNRRDYVYTLRPTRAGALELPPIEVSYYDTRTRSYQTVRTRPIPLNIRRGAEVTAGQIQGLAPRPQDKKKEMNLAAAPPASIRTDADGSVPAPLLAEPWMLAVGAAGPSLYLAVFLGGLVRQRSGQWKIAVRRRGALAAARRRLAAARRRARNEPGRAGREIRAAIGHYLADRLGVPLAGITPEDARRRLAEAGVAAPAAEHLAAIFERYFNAGFSHQADMPPPDDDIRQISRILETIDRETQGRKALPAEHTE